MSATSPHSLGDDLNSVYDWLKEPLIVWSHGSDDAIRSALFGWRFHLEIHDGAHLTDAIKAVHWLLHRHGQDDDDE